MQCPQRKLFNPLGRFPRALPRRPFRLTADLAGLLSSPRGRRPPLEDRPGKPAKQAEQLGQPLVANTKAGCLSHRALETPEGDGGGGGGGPSKCIVRDRTSLLAFWRVKPRPGQQQLARGQPAPHIKAGGPGRLANCQRCKEQQGSVLPQDNSKLGQGRVCKFQALGRSARDFTLSSQGSDLISFEGEKKRKRGRRKHIRSQTFCLQKQTPQCTRTPSGPFSSPPLSKTIQRSQT